MKEIIINTDNVIKPTKDNSFEENRRNVYHTNDECEISVCVMAYNRLEKTKLCVESVLKYTKDVNYTLVLADNGSTDETYEYFKSVEYPNKVLIKITKNISGVYGSNRILSHIKTKYYVLLGNDTVMTPNWLSNMLICMKSDEQIGMVAPLSTNTEERQVPNIPQFSTIEELQHFAAGFNISDSTKWEEETRLIPIVALYKMEVFDIAGKYDPGFFHEFTEDDHEIRMRNNGYKIILCGDTFIHHNHIFTERNDMDVRVQASASGKSNYYKKHGVDAWEDIMNYVSKYLSKISIKDTSQANILGVDVKCGTPILDAKNKYRSLGVEKLYSSAFTTDVKYYANLETVADHVIHDDIDKIRLHYKQEEFDCLMMGNPVNTYDAPLKRVEECFTLVKKDGYLLVSLKNNYDFQTFLNLFSFMKYVENDMPTMLHYTLLLNKLHELKVKEINIDYTLHNINLEFMSMIKECYLRAGIAEKGEEEHDKLYINKYWFCIKK